MKIYLDNCCYNRPYDDQSHLRISLETQAKLFVQSLIRDRKVQLVSSYILDYENSQNPYEMRKNTIYNFLQANIFQYVDIDQSDKVKEKASNIMNTGIKAKDALHVASAVLAECDYFLSTDDRLLKYQTDEICMINPVDFVKIWEEDHG